MNRRKYIPAILVMFILFFMIAFFVTGLQKPFGCDCQIQFGLSNWASQLGNLLNFMAYALMGLQRDFS